MNKVDVNFKFYVFLKEINGTEGLNVRQINDFLEAYYLYAVKDEKSIEGAKLIFSSLIAKIKSEDKKSNMNYLLSQIKNSNDLILFIFSLKLLFIKPFLLEEAKLLSSSEVIKKQELHPLSVAYDRIGKTSAYCTRVHGALISLLFFEHLEKGKAGLSLSNISCDYIKELAKEFEIIKKYEVEPNQIFMLMFSEVVNQSIVSKAGRSYEERIFNLLVGLGISPSEITKKHDEVDKSTEYDFFFDIEGRTYGVGAKRTLRERYKQFIKTAYSSHIDVMIEMTLGLDLTEDKAKTIRQHNVYLFVAEEIYQTRQYLAEMEGVYPASSLDIDLLKRL